MYIYAIVLHIYIHKDQSLEVINTDTTSKTLINIQLCLTTLQP